ncbi:protein of unassigned function [Methylobacterium oryzae CBMB20]|uniref:Protein of unassigned function n=1 Tax=Methylobacterium oryzae CBMB20 TaxID=693986 RepID=A0A089NQL9_9HYPH|nr:protein of unassigned function [Methylobacterium oryzae CBMB20]
MPSAYPPGRAVIRAAGRRFGPAAGRFEAGFRSGSRPGGPPGGLPDHLPGLAGFSRAPARQQLDHSTIFCRTPRLGRVCGQCCIAAKMRLLRNGSAGCGVSASIPLSFRRSL